MGVFVFWVSSEKQKWSVGFVVCHTTTLTCWNGGLTEHLPILLTKKTAPLEMLVFIAAFS